MLNALLGIWNLKRTITPHGYFSGEATFTEIRKDTLQYIEHGVLTLENGEILTDVQKRYIYKREGDAIAVYFDDGPDKGKLFHRLVFNDEGVAEASHDCPPDTYKTKMHAISSEEFTLTHDVSGPRKAYQIQSHYKKRAS